MTFGPLIRTWMPLTALPPWVTWIFSVCLPPHEQLLRGDPADRDAGDDVLIDRRRLKGGGRLVVPVFVSGRSPDTAAVFVCGPAVLGVVISVIVTCSPAAIVPRVAGQDRATRAGAVRRRDAETNVFPAGIGSVIFNSGVRARAVVGHHHRPGDRCRRTQLLGRPASPTS